MLQLQVAQGEACNHIDKEQRVTATSCSGESIQNFLQITYSWFLHVYNVEKPKVLDKNLLSTTKFDRLNKIWLAQQNLLQFKTNLLSKNSSPARTPYSHHCCDWYPCHFFAQPRNLLSRIFYFSKQLCEIGHYKLIRFSMQIKHWMNLVKCLETNYPESKENFVPKHCKMNNPFSLIT